MQHDVERSPGRGRSGSPRERRGRSRSPSDSRRGPQRDLTRGARDSRDDRDYRRQPSRSPTRPRRSGRSRSPSSPRRQRRRSPNHSRRSSRSRSQSRSRSRERSRRSPHRPSNRRSSRSRSPPRRRPPSRSPPPARSNHGRRSRDAEPQRHGQQGRDRSRSPLGSPRGYPEGRGGRDFDRGPHRGHDRGGQRGPPPSQEAPDVGTIHHAIVHSVRPFGVFVELPGYRKQGLVHHSQISEEIKFGRDDEDEAKVKAMEFFLPRGEKVWVKVVEVRREDGRDPRVGCSMKAVDQETGEDLDPHNTLAGPRGGGARGPESEEPPEVNSIHRAAVQSVRPFGVFVKMEGFRKYGLVHVSQISDHMDMSREDSDEEKIAAISSVLAVGEPVYVKVVEVKQDERGPKVGCSIKLVSQKDGADLDPHNLKYRPRPEGGGPPGREAIGAHVAEAHGDKVEWGHLQADVVQYGGQGRQYEILGDDSPERPRALAPPGARNGPPEGHETLPPRGRGRGSVLPAWMTGGAPGAPNSSGAGLPASEPGGSTGGGGGAKITSVEDALAILEQLGKGKSKKHKKEKKKKHKKERKKEKKEKKSKKRSRRDSSSGSSGSGSD